ncbi:MAG: hypothetical protein AAGN46_12785 [Acidobacteriota bacterium]
MHSPYALHRPVANEFLRRDRDHQRRRELLAVTAAVLVAGGALLGYVSIHLETTQVGYRIDALERGLHTLQEEQRRLEIALERATHPRRVEARAGAELGMRPPRLGETFFYDALRAEVPLVASVGAERSDGPPAVQAGGGS